MGSRVGGFLRSRRNVVGCLLAAGGVGLFATGIVAGLAALPLTAGLYVLGAVVVPPRRRVLDPYPEDATDAAGVRHALDELVRSLAGRVPSEIFDRVSSIRASILVTLDHGAGTAVADPNVFLIRQTALSYLPEALNEYLSLPRAYANRSLAGRKSAHDVLIDQLNLMDDKMREVAEAVVADDAEKLEAHGRFLADKFGASSLDLRAAEKARAKAEFAAAMATEPAAEAGAGGGLAAAPAPAPAAQPAQPAAIDKEARRSAERRAVAARVAIAARRASAIAAELSGANPPEGNVAAAVPEPTTEPAAAQAAEAAQAAADYKDSLDRIRG